LWCVVYHWITCWPVALSSGVLFPFTKLMVISTAVRTPASGPHLLSHAAMALPFPESLSL